MPIKHIFCREQLIKKKIFKRKTKKAINQLIIINIDKNLDYFKLNNDGLGNQEGWLFIIGVKEWI